MADRFEPPGDDALVSSVARTMWRDDEVLDRRIEALVLGQLSPLEVARLERDAKADVNLARALDLARPVENPSPYELRGAREVAVRRWGRRAAIAAIAASVALVVWPTGPIPIPAYETRMQTNDARWRNELADRRTTLRADSTLAIVLKPVVPVQGVTDAILYVMTTAGTRRSTTAAERSADGAARWLGSAEHITDVDSGLVRLVAIVGRPSALPNAEDAIREGRGPGWQATTVTLQIDPVPKQDH